MFVFVSNVKINFNYLSFLPPLYSHLSFKEKYSVHQIESKTGLGRFTVGRIEKKKDLDKENSKGGCPSKLSSHNKQSIIHKITTGKLDNAVQAAHFINDILPSPVTPQRVRNALKERNFCSVVKQK